MNTAPFKLEADFASALPTMAAPWQGEEAPNPELVILNDDLAYSLGLDPTWLRTPEGVQFLLGLNPEPLTKAVAQAYSGHQFGQFVASLGDGRALAQLTAYCMTSTSKDLDEPNSPEEPMDAPSLAPSYANTSSPKRCMHLVFPPPGHLQ